MERRVDAIYRYTAQDLGRGRSLADARLRATLRADIDAAIHRHTMMRADAHEAAGLRAGALDDDSLDIDALRQVLATLRAIPGGMADLSFELGTCS